MNIPNSRTIELRSSNISSAILLLIVVYMDIYSTTGPTSRIGRNCNYICHDSYLLVESPSMAGQFMNRDVIRRYSNREMRYFLARGFSHLRPCVLRQLIYQTSLPVNLFRELVIDLLNEHCTEFAAHSLKWEYLNPHADILDRMVQYENVWEGWACDEPWSNSSRKRIIYFFDTEFQSRNEEMVANFLRNP